MNEYRSLKTISGEKVVAVINEVFDLFDANQFSFDEGMAILSYSVAQIIHQVQLTVPNIANKETDMIADFSRSVTANLEMIRVGEPSMN